MTHPDTDIRALIVDLHDAIDNGDPLGIAGSEEAICEVVEKLEMRVGLLFLETERLDKLLNTPELHDFAKAVTLEAAHQRERWGAEHDAGKGPEDWFWVVGYLAGKALRTHIDGNIEKALHHTITTAALLNNWHAALLGASTSMRPGIGPGSSAHEMAVSADGPEADG